MVGFSKIGYMFKKLTMKTDRLIFRAKIQLNGFVTQTKQKRLVFDALKKVYDKEIRNENFNKQFFSSDLKKILIHS